MTFEVSHTTIDAAAAEVRQRTPLSPRVAVITGSGLGPLADQVEDAIYIAYDTIPYFPVSTVEGHDGKLVMGTIADCPVVVMRGRFHFYEGYSFQEVTFPVRVMHALGADTLIVTNAAGGLNPDFHVGDLMLIQDHISLPAMTGHSPLRGHNDTALGPRFPSLVGAYDRDLRDQARRIAAQQGLTVRQGVYTMCAGPSFETPAEIRFLRLIGGDAVGMSTAPEVTVARHGGMRVLGISLITNRVETNSDGTPLAGEAGHHEVLATAEAAVPRLTALVRGIIAAM